MAVSTLLLFNLGRSDAREERQLSTRERRVAARPRGSASRKSKAPIHRPNSVGFGLRRLARASKMLRRKPGGSTNRKSSAHSSSARAPRAADASPSPRTAIPFGIALFALSSSGRSLRSLKRASRVAGLRCGRLRPARLYEPQELGSKNQSKPRPKVQPNSSSFGLRILRVD